MSPLRFHGRHSQARVHIRAFSLIELLITMAIIIILYTMMFGFGARQNQLRQKTKCRSNLQKMYVSLQIYANDSRGMFPITTNAQTSEAALGVRTDCLRGQQDVVLTHDHLFHTVMGLLGVTSREYRQALDVSYACRSG